MRWLLPPCTVVLCVIVGQPTPAYALQNPSEARVELVGEVPLREDSSVFLQRPVGATRFGNGLLAVADGLGQTVHYFDGTGRYLRSVGRAGEGPGEFSTPGWLGRCGDSVAAVWDFSLMRVTTLSQSGAVTEQYNLRDRADLPRPPARMACSRSGHFVALLRLGGERIDRGDFNVMTAPLYSFGPGQGVTLIDPAVRVIEWLDEERTYRPVSPTTHFAAFGSSIFLAPSDSLVVHVLGIDGVHRGSWPLQLTPREPMDAHVQHDAETRTAFVADYAAQADLIERHMALPRPVHLPYHSGLHVDEAGGLWLVTSYPGDESTTLQAYDSSGSVLGQVDIPVGIEVYEVTNGHVVGWRIDPQSLEPKVMVFRFDLAE